MNDLFRDNGFVLPQFVVKTEPSLFSEDEYVLLEKKNLQVGFYT